MADDKVRIDVDVTPESREKLSRLAARIHECEDAVASALLMRAIDDADTGPEAPQIVRLLDAIPGARARIEVGVLDARAGRTIPLEDL